VSATVGIWDAKILDFGFKNRYIPLTLFIEKNAFSCNYLANIPEIIDLVKATKEQLPNTFIFVGGHSASFTAREILQHGEGVIDCILKGEGEASVGQLLEAVKHDRSALTTVPGIVTPDGQGLPPIFVNSLDDLRPARHLLRDRSDSLLPLISLPIQIGTENDLKPSVDGAWKFRKLLMSASTHLIQGLKHG
jgi:radical SAM superfamily enzyme YgiQ (UPF0313 family)